MPTLPPRHQQIIQAHAGLIRQIAMGCLDATQRAAAEQLIQAAESHGWTDLAPVLRRILGGQRDNALLGRLRDEEDRVIAEAILAGIQNPASLPDPAAAADPEMAAPGLAHMIDAAARGDTQALQLLANMAEMMSQAGGDMARLAAALRPMLNGERDPERLCKGMSGKGEKLVLGILAELGRRSGH